MRQTVQLTVPMPAKMARLRFPKALDDRLHFLLDEQGRKGKLTPAEKKEMSELVQKLASLYTRFSQNSWHDGEAGLTMATAAELASALAEIAGRL